MRWNLTLDVCANAAARVAMLAVCCNGWVLMVLAVQAKPPNAPPDRQNKAPLLVVRLYNHAGVPARILATGKKESVRIFLEAGIELSWVPCPVSDREYENARKKFAGCLHAVDAPTVSIDAIPNARSVPRNKRPSAGTAAEEQIAVSYDRVEQVSADFNVPRSTLLGHVLAHELGHFLLGENSHSADGIMVALFRDQDLRRAERGKLLFTVGQAEQMRAKIRRVALRADLLEAPKK